MTKFGILLILACALTGGLFYFWSAAASQTSSSAPLCGVETQTPAPKDVDFGPYMAAMQKRLKAHWYPPKTSESKSIEVVFAIHANGIMSNLRLLKASGIALADQAALKAVQDASPFAPLPEGAPDRIDVQFTFDYNVAARNSNCKIFRRF